MRINKIKELVVDFTRIDPRDVQPSRTAELDHQRVNNVSGTLYFMAYEKITVAQAAHQQNICMGKWLKLTLLHIYELFL